MHASALLLVKGAAHAAAPALNAVVHLSTQRLPSEALPAAAATAAAPGCTRMTVGGCADSVSCCCPWLHECAFPPILHGGVQAAVLARQPHLLCRTPTGLAPVLGRGWQLLL